MLSWLSMENSIKAVTHKDLTEQDRLLLDAASDVMSLSYAPYSGFFVGAALQSCDGDIIVGTNFENAAYPSGICAERAAVARANSEGRRCFTSIAIIGRGKDFDSEEVIAPCGFCRQVLNEIAQISGNDLDVIMSNTQKTKIIKLPLSQLLPLAFGPKDVGLTAEDIQK